MPPKTTPKKRTRKRKRRQASSSSSESSSSSSSVSSKEVIPRQRASAAQPPDGRQNHITQEPSLGDESEGSESSSDVSSTSGDSEEDGNGDVQMKFSTTNQPSRSPSPVDHSLSMDIPLRPSTEDQQRRDAEMKEKFRTFWMRSMAEGFGEEFGQIQKEPNMTQPKLSMLIDALASGSNLYMPRDGSTSTSERSEVEVLLGIHK